MRGLLSFLYGVGAYVACLATLLYFIGFSGNLLPEPFHIGYPGFVYGGTIASVVDCHSIWTAIATYCRDNGHDMAEGPPPFAFVTGKLSVNYLKPAVITEAPELRARVIDHGDRRCVVGCRVLQQGVECANAEVVTAA